MTAAQDIIDIIRGKKSFRNIIGKNNILELPSKKKDIKLRIIGDNNSVKLPARSKISLLVFGNNNTVKFDSNIIGFGASINVGTPDTPVNNCTVTVGKDSTSNGINILILDNNTNVKIGENCMFSSNITMLATDAHAIVDYDGNLLNVGKELVFGDNVWVGFGATILKNSIIPNNCVIGAKSVVAGRFDETNCILAGSPAKIIKKNIVWHRMRPDQYLSEHQG